MTNTLHSDEDCQNGQEMCVCRDFHWRWKIWRNLFWTRTSLMFQLHSRAGSTFRKSQGDGKLNSTLCSSPSPKPRWGNLTFFSLPKCGEDSISQVYKKNSELIFPHFPFIATIDMYKDERVANLTIWQVDKMTQWSNNWSNIFFRKIQNGRQIMFQCDRGYSMIEGPSGATCIAGTCF